MRQLLSAREALRAMNDSRNEGHSNAAISSSPLCALLVSFRRKIPFLWRNSFVASRTIEYTLDSASNWRERGGRAAAPAYYAIRHPANNLIAYYFMATIAVSIKINIIREETWSYDCEITGDLTAPCDASQL